MSLHNAARVVHAEHKRFTGESTGNGEDGDWRKTQMFLPVASEGQSVIKVTTRQSFLNNGISAWRSWQLTRVGAAVAGAGAVWLFFAGQPILAGAGALVAGWLYGQHVRVGFFITKLLKKRYLLEGT